MPPDVFDCLLPAVLSDCMPRDLFDCLLPVVLRDWREAFEPLALESCCFATQSAHSQLG